MFHYKGCQKLQLTCLGIFKETPLKGRVAYKLNSFSNLLIVTPHTMRINLR